uniref:ATP-binding cassette domain-containing protein n=1 Tax=Bacteroidetes bacterium endosymbiont of Geopemphigus sp. TaxID=2047937 RepID=UPI002AD2744B|nr:ATP-binding cassette domain-containing protein [Bacteroidetes bacterium endosymbiont of Geopemphigus sp.]
MVGKNGAGKSTMLKILSGELSLKKGQISREGEINVGFLRQDIDFKKDRTVWQEAESVFERIKTIEKSLQEINEILSERTDYESKAYQKIIEEFSELTKQYHLLGGYTIAENIEKILLGLGFSSEDFSRSTE